MEIETLDRRIYRGELARALGFSTEWTRRLERSGRLPAGRRDPGSRRPYWLQSEVAQIVAGERAPPEKQQAAA